MGIPSGYKDGKTSTEMEEQIPDRKCMFVCVQRTLIHIHGHMSGFHKYKIFFLRETYLNVSRVQIFVLYMTSCFIYNEVTEQNYNLPFSNCAFNT